MDFQMRNARAKSLGLLSLLFLSAVLSIFLVSTPSPAHAVTATVTIILTAAPGSSVLTASNYIVATYTSGGTGGHTANLVDGTNSITADVGTQVSLAAKSSASTTTERWCILQSISADGSTCVATTFYPGGGITVTYEYADQLLEFSSFGTSGGAIPSAVNTNLVGWWKLDEGTGTTTADSSGNGNTGTLEGTPIPQWLNPAQCVSGGCLNFNSAATQYVSATSTGFPTGSAAISAFAWFYPTGFASSQEIFSYGAGVGSGQFDLFLYTAGTLYNSYAGQSGLSPPLGQWDFVGITYAAGSSSMTIYLNGQSQVMSLAGPLSIAPGGSVYIGYQTANQYPMNGRIDDVRFYSIALSAAQELQQYQSYQPTMNYMTGSPAAASSIIGSWPLDEGSGVTANDASPNNNPGTLTNSPTWTNSCGPALLECLSFSSSSSEYVGMGAYPNPAGSFTITAWFETSSTQSQAILAHGYVASETGWLMRIDLVGGKYVLDCSIQSGASFIVASGTTAINDGNWHFGACVFSSASYIEIYVDGVGYFSTTAIAGAANANAFRIGVDDAGNYFNGKIGAVQLYSIALTPTQVQQEYQSYFPTTNGLTLATSTNSVWANKGSVYTTTTPTQGLSTTERWAANEAQTNGLVGYWPMEEESGAFTADLSGNGHYGTLVNSPTWASGASCKFGDCLSFASASHQYTATNPISFPSSFTVSVWWKTTQAFSQISDWGYSSQNNGMELYTDNGKFGCAINDGTHTISLDSGSNANNGAFHLFTCVFVAGSSLTTYMDGAEVATSAGSTSMIGSSPFWLAFNGVATWGTGSADDLRIYSAALSAGQVAELYSLATFSTLTTSGTISPTYYHQYSGTVAYALSVFFYDTATTVIFTRYGGMATATLTTSLTAYWMDSTTSCSATNPLGTSTSSQRWDTGTQCNSGSPISAAFSQTLTYYNQFLLTYSYAILGGGTVTAPTLTCSAFGSPYAPSLTTSATGYWCDTGQSWTVPNPLTNSGGTERWDTTTTVTGTVSAALTTLFSYTHQYALVVLYSIADSGLSNHPNMAYTSFGSPTSLGLTTSYQTVWADAGSSWTATSPFVSQPDLKTWYPSPRGGTVPAGQGQSDSPFTITYSSQTPSCGAATAVGSEEAGCYAQSFFQVWLPLIGLNFFMGFLVGAPLIAMWIKSENSWYPMILFIAAGGIFAGGLPNTFGVLGVVFATIGLIGVVYKVFTRPQAG